MVVIQRNPRKIFESYFLKKKKNTHSPCLEYVLQNKILKEWAGWEVEQNENLHHLEMKPYSPVTSLEIMSYLVLVSFLAPLLLLNLISHEHSVRSTSLVPAQPSASFLVP